MSRQTRHSPLDIEISIGGDQTSSVSESERDAHASFDGNVSGDVSSAPETIIDTTSAAPLQEKEKSFARHEESMKSWKPEWAFSGDEIQKDEARKLWFLFFFATVMCALFSIVSISTAAIYSIPSTTSSTATFRYGYFRACVMIERTDDATNTTISCDSYSALQTSLTASNITDFEAPSGLSAARAFSVIEVIALFFLIFLIILLVRSSSSSFVLLRLCFVSLFILVCTIISLVCLLVSSSDRVLMFGGAFQVIICLAMAAEAAAATMFIRRGQKFAGICSNADHELVRKISKL